jgi:type II secretion system protein N
MIERLRRYWKLAATGGFGLLVFVAVLVFTLPYERVKDYIVAMADQKGYDVEIKSAGPALGLGLRLKDVVIATRPSDASKPTRLLVPQASLRMSLLGLLAGHKTYQVFATPFGGELEIESTDSKTSKGLRVQAKDIDLADIPFVKAAINLPMFGSIELHLDAKMPSGKAGSTAGSLTWTCSDCALGDGKAKLIIPGNALLAEGLGLPKIRLGDFVGTVVIEKGVGRLQGVQAKSPDGEITLEGEIKLADNMKSSTLDLYVRFKLSDALLKSSEKLRTIMQFAGTGGKRTDGFYGVRITGPLTHLGQPVWSKNSPFAAPATGPKPLAPKPASPPPFHAPPPPIPPPAPPPMPTASPIPMPTSMPMPLPSGPPPAASPPPAPPPPPVAEPTPPPPPPPPPAGDPTPPPGPPPGVPVAGSIPLPSSTGVPSTSPPPTPPPGHDPATAGTPPPADTQHR